MARNIQELTLAYMEAHPADAARVLEHISTEHAGALLESLPARVCAPVIRSMMPSTAARCMGHLQTAAAAGLIQALGPQAGAAVLRHLSNGQRAGVFDQLPSSSALAFRLLLSYPQDTVGAWMDTRAPAFTADTPVTEALERLRVDDDSGAQYLYVVDSDQRLRGVASLIDVVRAGATATLAQVMRHGDYRLPARAPITSVHTHSGWREFHSLAVVERHDRFVGALHFPTLSHALAHRRPAHAPAPMGDALGNLAGAYWSVFSGLIQAALGLLTTSVTPTTRETPDDR